MKLRILAMLVYLAACELTGCSSGSSPAATNPPPAKVTGVETPKSVSVVTAN
jgi:hypothetical protein